MHSGKQDKDYIDIHGIHFASRPRQNLRDTLEKEKRDIQKVIKSFVQTVRTPDGKEEVQPVRKPSQKAIEKLAENKHGHELILKKDNVVSYMVAAKRIENQLAQLAAESKAATKVPSPRPAPVPTLTILYENNAIHPATEPGDACQWEYRPRPFGRVVQPWSNLGASGNRPIRPVPTDGKVRLSCGDLKSNAIDLGRIVRQQRARAKRATYRLSADSPAFQAKAKGVAERILSLLNPRQQHNMRPSAFQDRVFALPKHLDKDWEAIRRLCTSGQPPRDFNAMVEFCDRTIYLDPSGLQTKLNEIGRGETITLRIDDDDDDEQAAAKEAEAAQQQRRTAAAAKEDEAKQLFAAMDKNGVGSLSHTQIQTFLGRDQNRKLKDRLGISDRSWQGLWAVLDTNNDKRVSREEWVRFYTGLTDEELQAGQMRIAEAIKSLKNRQGDTDFIEEVFATHDENEDGFISMKELPATLVAVGGDPSNAKAMLEANDVDKNDKLSYGEFLFWCVSSDVVGNWRDKATAAAAAKLREHGPFNQGEWVKFTGTSNKPTGWPDADTSNMVHLESGYFAKVKEWRKGNAKKKLYLYIHAGTRPSPRDPGSWSLVKDPQIIAKVEEKSRAVDAAAAAALTSGESKEESADGVQGFEFVNSGAAAPPAAPPGDLSNMVANMTDDWASSDDELNFAEESDSAVPGPTAEPMAAESGSALEFAESSAVDTDSEVEMASRGTTSGLEFAESSATESTKTSGLEFAESSAADTDSGLGPGSSSGLGWAESSDYE